MGVDVTGRVVDDDGGPVGGAEIWMCTLTGGWTQDVLVARSDSAGRFRVGQAPRGISFGARAAGFGKSAIVDLDEVDRSIEPVEISLRLRSGGTQLHGIVVGDDGSPIQGVTVVAGKVRSNGMGLGGSRVERWSSPRATTDQDGEFRFVGLDLGECHVYARKPGHAVAHQSIMLAEGAANSVEMTLPRGAVLEGVVFGLDGLPQPQASIHVFGERINETFLQSGQVTTTGAFGHPATKTDEQGRYRLTQVPCGAVVAYALGPVPAPGAGGKETATFVREGLELTSGQVLQWSPRLDEGRVIEGRIVYSEGKPMTDVFVFLRRGDGGDKASSLAVYTRDGAFKFIQLEDTTYNLWVQLGQVPDGGSEPRMNGVRPGGSPIRLVADFPTPTTTKPSIVRIRVDDAVGSGTGNLGAKLESRGGRPSWYIGRETDGVWTIEVNEPGRYGPLVVRGERIVWVGDEMELVGGEELDLGVARLENEASLVLHIEKPEDAELSNLTAYLSPSGVWDSESVSLDGFKEKRVDGMLPGEYDVRITGNGVVPVVSSVVLHADQVAELSVKLRAAVKVSYTVQREHPESPDSMLIQLIDRGDDSVPHEFSADDMTRYANPFEWRAWLAPGSYVFKAVRGDGRVLQQDFEIPSLSENDLPKVHLDFR